MLLGCALAPASLAAQQPVLVRHFSLPAMDIGVLSDSVRGVSLVAAPSLLTPEGQQATKITWLRFAPDSLLQWLNVADAYLRAPARGNEPDGTRWAPRLTVIENQGWLSFGRRIKKHRLARELYVSMADSGYGWSFEMSQQEVDSMLHILLEAGAVSRLVKQTGMSGRGDLCENPDQPVTIVHQPKLKSESPGRVAMQFVVDTTGWADMGTFVAIFATSPSLEEAARTAIAQSRFKPAVWRGQLVRQLVQQAAVVRSSY